MQKSNQLNSALESIDANALIEIFTKQIASVEKLSVACERLALWANSLSASESGNPALAFLSEMQRASHDVALLIASALYVPAAAAMRSACETAIYYTYFRTHPAELTTLVNNSEYFISKKEILEFHKEHSFTYRSLSGEFGLPGDLNVWYSKISAIVHGQLPGTWGRRTALKDTKHDLAILPSVVDTFSEGVNIINMFLLLTTGVEVWGSLHHETKSTLLKGMSADHRQKLNIDGKR